MKRINDFFLRLRHAWNILTRRERYFYASFADCKSEEDTLRSAAFIASTLWFNRHDAVSAKARVEMMHALLCDHDTLMYAKEPDGTCRALYACDTPQTLNELRNLDFEADEDTDSSEPTNDNDHGADNR